MQTIYTMGYTQKSLEDFVRLLTDHKIEKVIDIRLKNTSQLAGFAKQDDLRYILEHFLKIEYEHVPQLSPTEAIFTRYKKDKVWDALAMAFSSLMAERKMDEILEKAAEGKQNICLLCSEDSAKKCHRRLIAEYYQKKKAQGVRIIHLTAKDARP
jgi:uncharacterized protein (DUF488 family)